MAARFLDAHSRKTFRVICEANGLDEDEIMQQGVGPSPPHSPTLLDRVDDDLEDVQPTYATENTNSCVRMIEMFMNVDYQKIECMDAFGSSLVELHVVCSSITKIEGLDTLVNLRILYLNDNDIARIEGLSSLRKLKRLYLQNNQIKKIEGFDNLVELEILWLANNEIEEIENVEFLSRLRQLHLGKNRITAISNSLETLPNLRDLNLAGNRISSFSEIPKLKPLRSLISLSLSDAHFGESPVAGLCNYSVYVLYHLKQLKVLDTVEISPQARQMAEATYIKKRMYYNMRIKTLKRNGARVLDAGTDIRQGRVGQIQLSANVLARQLCDVERELQVLDVRDHQSSSEPSESESDFEVPHDMSEDSNRRRQLTDKLSSLRNALQLRRNQKAKIDRLYEIFRLEVLRLGRQTISCLVTELETGGNIRLEDGKPSDVWFSSCTDLVRSRFYASDYEAYGIIGVKVRRVIRVHNRFLRARFEDHVETVQRQHEQILAGRKNLEYLFSGELPGINNLFLFCEDGMPTPGEFTEAGYDEAVLMSNSLSVADLPRLSAWRRVPANKGDSIPGGALIVSKVYLGNCVPEKSATWSNGRGSSDQGPPRIKDASGWVGSAPMVREKDYSNTHAIYRSKPGDSKQRQYFVFDNALCLPEYFVEFDYIQRKGHSDPSIPVPNPVTPEGEAVSPDVAALLRPLSLLAGQCEAFSGKGDDVSTNALSMPPAITPRPKAFTISEELILQQTGTDSFSNMTYLNLHGCSLRKIENVGRLTNLRTLVLSFNEITTIENLSHIHSIETLDLGFNLIKKVDGLKDLVNLRTLYLNNNLLYRLEDVAALRKCVPNVTTLDLRANAVTEIKGYRDEVIRRLPRLSMLDLLAVSREERIAASTSTHQSEILLEDKICYLYKRDLKQFLSPRPERVMRASGDEKQKRSALRMLLNSIGEKAWQSVYDIDLCSRKLRKIPALDKLTSLRRIVLNDNEIGRISNLESCSQLEEVYLENNRITKIEFLSSFKHLRRLDLGSNLITRLESLENLTHLTQLSLERNEISVLTGLASAVNLMELYLAGNRIGELKALTPLRQLPKLIIADFTGNVLSEDVDYRHYCIYHLKKLKVLDGVGIDQEEQSASNEKYCGRVTTELLVQLIGHSFFDHVSDLDLCNNGLKELHGLSTGDFPSLTRLDLSRNRLNDLSTLINVPTLKILNLNHNRLQMFGQMGAQGKGGKDKTTGLYGLPNLKELDLSYNKITSLSNIPFRQLRELNVLNLSNNEISRVENLGSQQKLRLLRLDSNRIKYVDGESFAGLLNVQELRLDDNGMRSLANFYPLPKLEKLNLNRNRIATLQDLESISHLQALVELYLIGNSVARKPMYRSAVIFRLRGLLYLDGRDVTQEERERAFNLISHAQAAPQNIIPDTRTGGHRVAVKMTSLKFDTMYGLVDKKPRRTSNERRDRQSSGVGRRNSSERELTGEPRMSREGSARSGRGNVSDGGRNRDGSTSFRGSPYSNLGEQTGSLALGKRVRKR